MRKINYFFLVFYLIFLALAPQAIAAKSEDASNIRNANDTASGIPARPYKVIVNQQNAQVYAQCMARVVLSIEGEKVLIVPFPKSAENIQMFLPMHEGKDQGKITSWIMEKSLPFKPQGDLEKRRITFESMHDSLAGSLAVLQAQEAALVDELKEKSNVLDPKFTGKLNPNLALIGTRISSTKRELDYAKQRVEQFQDGLPTSQQFVVRIDSPLPENAEALVAYTYTLSNTFWKPVYIMNANTKDNTIDVQLLAELTQNSDLDWLNVQLELTTAQGTERDPSPLFPWIVRKATGNAIYAKGRMAPQAMMLSSEANDASGPTFTQGTAMARWVMQNVPKVVEGKTKIKLNQEKWSAALTRIARPASSDNKVWLNATHKIDSSFYPAGEATFLLDSVTTGQGVFAPSGGEAKLFFGVDPLVTVETKQKERKSAEDGIIDKDQTWTWSWIYSAENKRNTSISVRIEEPQTQVEDASMSVSYKDEPKPEQGPEKTFIWNLNIPANGNKQVKRSITIKAPKDMPINLGR